MQRVRGELIRMCDLGSVVIAMVAAIVLNGSCIFGTKNTVCEDGTLCPVGWACTAAQDGCQRDGCGDGEMRGSEVCDDGNKIDGDGCDSNCTPSGCGNGVRANDEMCDDGDMIEGNGCDTNCRATGCGNGIRTPMEECDDGNAVSGDGCSLHCARESCGNGILEYSKEQCDLGSMNSDEGVCTRSCELSRCGDGKTYMNHEECDDGNQVEGDSCDSNCTLPRCGNGIKASNEQCDDGNQVEGDSCDSNCTLSRCGNGVRAGNEQCDDGNLTCGTCDDKCEKLASAQATGAIIVINANNTPNGILDGDRFKLDDGINAELVFEFDRNGVLNNLNHIPVFIGVSADPGHISTVIELAINLVQGELLIAAEVSATSQRTVSLRHERFTREGDRPIVQYSDGINVSGMKGGKGGDCMTGNACRSNADCLSNVCNNNVCQ